MSFPMHPAMSGSRIRLEDHRPQQHPHHRRGLLGWCGVLGALAFAGFLELFALDLPVFSLGFVMQSLPALVILIGGLLGWWRSWAGAAWLGAAAILALVFFGPGRHWTWPLVVNGPPLLLAGMFALDALRRKRKSSV